MLRLAGVQEELPAPLCMDTSAESSSQRSRNAAPAGRGSQDVPSITFPMEQQGAGACQLRSACQEPVTAPRDTTSHVAPLLPLPRSCSWQGAAAGGSVLSLPLSHPASRDRAGERLHGSAGNPARPRERGDGGVSYHQGWGKSCSSARAMQE